MPRKRSSWIKLALPIPVAIIVIIIAFLFYRHYYVIDGNSIDAFERVKKLGYERNLGLSGLYRAGDVIQTTESTPDGKGRPLRPPIVFLWATDCFPAMKPSIAPLPLPETSGTSEASLGVGAEYLADLVPSINFRGSGSADYSLKLEKVRIETYAKGNLSGKLSKYCIDALERQRRGGENPEWFAVILESVVADKLVLSINWKTDTSAEARMAAVQAAKQDMIKLGTGRRGESKGGQAKIDVVSRSSKQTSIESNGPAVLGYKARPLFRNVLSH